ncbi:MAG: 6-carboxyhexanoate--CoA ligase [Nitrospirae bacterium]|nr:6-carboxyhexanoate--CoA ligase [Nitrospirota bacterium]
MRASKKSGRIGSIHISGAETICTKQKLSIMAQQYIERALTHSRGLPDEIVVSVEEITEKPLNAYLLKASTIQCSSPAEARRIIAELLIDTDISGQAVASGFKILDSKKRMRGASLILSNSAARVEPDRSRGVRVSRFGLSKNAFVEITKINRIKRSQFTTVAEAISLASKTAAHPDILAEVCISDDPDYTTGYIASSRLGYIRIPNIKSAGDMRGGRVIYLRQDSKPEDVIKYLEKMPVIIKRSRNR